MFYALQSKILRVFRATLSSIGFAVGLLFVIVGATHADSGDLFAAYTIGVGSLLALLSLCVCCTGVFADKRIDRAINEIKERNEELRQSVSSLETLGSEYTLENAKLRDAVGKLGATNTNLEQRTAELHATSTRLQELNREYHKSLQRSEYLAQELSERVTDLEEARDAAQEEVQELRELVDEQKAQIEQLAQQARNLNELQRQSVHMIQQLALYGDKAKKFGTSLADISKELRETDESLGLTSQEMQQQIVALRKVTDSLQQTNTFINRLKQKNTNNAGMV